MRVGGVMPKARATRIVEGEKTRPHRKNRTPARGNADAAVVSMPIVGGAPVNWIVVGIVGRSAPGGGASLVRGVGVAAGVIGVGLVGEGRGQEREIGRASCRERVARTRGGDALTKQ